MAPGHGEQRFRALQTIPGSKISENLNKITVQVLVMNGEVDQVVPFTSSVPRAVDLLKNGSLKTYSGYRDAGA